MIRYLSIIFFLISTISCSQSKDFKEEINSLLDFDVDTISVTKLVQTDLKEVLIVDVREKEEFDVSKIPGSVHESELVLDLIDKNKTIIVYCSVGKRSEDFGRELKEEGFKNVLNLYGGIFQWFNDGNTVIDQNNISTIQIHTYSEKWSKWVTRGTEIY